MPKLHFSFFSRIRPLAIIIFLALIGILDTTYLLAERFLGGAVKCIAVQGCDTVLQSSYSNFFGFFPVALAGFLFYLAIFTLGLWLWGKSNISFFVRNLFSGLTVFGLVFSGWFFYVQAVLLQAFCTYCLISALDILLIFIVGIWWRYMVTNKL